MSRLERALERDAYCSGDVWERERDLVFARQWCVVGRTSAIAADGAVARFDLAGESVVIANDGGTLRGFFNVCRHRGAELVAPGVQAAAPGRCLQCPYHQWAYGLDGSLRRTPHLRDDERPAADLALHPVAVDTWGGFLFVRLEASASTLLDQLGPIPERIERYPLADLVPGASLTYDVAANWKVIAENYNECYHCGPVHPELCDLVPSFRLRGGSGLDWEDGIPHRDGAWTFTASGTSDRASFATLNAAERVRHKGELVYPNLLLSLSADHVAALFLFPTGPAHTRVVCDLLFASDEVARPTFDPSDATEFWDVVNRQDWSICESVQRGMSSRAFTHGYFAPMEDDSLHIRFWYEHVMGRDADV